MASIAKREEILYVYGQEDEPVVLDRHSPVLHLIQQIRDETHRFAFPSTGSVAANVRRKQRSRIFLGWGQGPRKNC